MVQSVNGVSEQRQSSGSLLPLTATLAGGAIGGLAIGDKIDSKNILKTLKEDKFELKGSIEADAPHVQSINDAIAEGKDDKVKEAVTAKVDEKLKTGDTITVEEYLGTSKEAYKADVEKVGNELETARATEINKKDAVKVASEEAGKVTDETAKKAADEKVKTAIKEAADAETAKKTLETKHTAMKAELEFAEKATDGKITKAALTEKITAEVKAAKATIIDQLIEQLSKKPKAASVKKGLIGAGVGLVAGIILSKMLTPKAEA